MFEAVIPAAIAAISGGGILINRLHNRIHDLDRRVDAVELRMVESFVSKGDFNSALDRMEAHLIRIEQKMDDLVNKPCP